MNRKILLLQNPGVEGQNLVPTVEAALNRYKRFFMSEAGGCWIDKKEIIEISQNHSAESEYTEVTMTLAKMATNCDYSIIVFVGHGDAYNGYDEIELSKGKKMPLTALMYNPLNEKILNRTIIVDACRSYVAPGETQILLESDNYSGSGQLNLDSCLDYYNELLVTPEPRLELIQSTQPGQKAFGSQYGTAFTDILFTVLDGCSKMWNILAMGNRDGKLNQTVKTVYDIVNQKMLSYNQHPQYRYWGYEGSFPLYAVSR